MRLEMFFKEPSESRTRIEYPVVADVDDGNEIVFSTSTESGFCSQRNWRMDPMVNVGTTPQPGIEVWGSQ